MCTVHQTFHVLQHRHTIETVLRYNNAVVCSHRNLPVSYYYCKERKINKCQFFYKMCELFCDS